MEKYFICLFVIFAISACSPSQVDSKNADTLQTATVVMTPPPPTQIPATPSPSPTKINPTATLILKPSLTAQIACGKSIDGRKVYLDERPALAIRQGPGCSYEEFQGKVTKTDPIKYFDVLGKQGDWLLVDLCSDEQGWIFAPAIDGMNIDVAMDDLPVLTAPPESLFTPTVSPPGVAKKELEQARKTLINFYDFLHDKNYEEAIKIFGGGYGIAINWNSDVDPLDYSELLMRACEWNGFQCFLKVKRIVKAEQVSPREYHFLVEFLNEDGSLYKRRGSQDNELKISQFQIRVVRDCNGKFFVIDWPFYEQYGP